MHTKKVTIKEIAALADVSIATVSHVINRTRYVSPELEEKVMRIVRETGYIDKVEQREQKLKKGRSSTVVAVFPNLMSTVYRDLAAALKKECAARGYQFLIGVTGDSLADEKQLLDDLISEKSTAGILLIPVSDAASDYRQLTDSGIPFICMERNVPGDQVDSAAFQDRKALYTAAGYLIEAGHKNILFLREASPSTTRDERSRGFLDALASHHMNINDANFTNVDLHSPEEICQRTIQKALLRVMPTAVIAGGNRLTLPLLTTIRNMGIQCPEDLSVVGFGDETWVGLVDPPLTTLERDVQGLGVLAANMLFEKILTGNVVTKERYAQIELKVRESTRILENGPYGEKAVSPSEIALSQEEKKRLRNGHFRVAISFHYTGTAWAELHEKGIRDELEQYGIDVISVMDAHFDADLQTMQLQSILIQQPDAVIAIPADDKRTAGHFQELAAVTKLVFISNLPENTGKNSYVSCVSVNEAENGANAGRMLGEYFHGKKDVKVGFINHGAVFYATRERDAAAEKALENFPNVEIVTSRGFGQIENAYQVCRDMVTAHPEIQALYVSWDQPALRAIRALKELHREDIAVFTTDLDTEIAAYMERGIVKGISTQRFYEQGRAAALAAAKSLVSDSVPKYVGVQPYMVEPKQLGRAWKEIFHTPMPDGAGKAKQATGA